MWKKIDCRFYDYFFIFILLSASYWLQHHVYFNWDASWHVEAARRMVAGDASYSKNIFDDNLPMVYWYFIPAVILNHLTGMWVVSLSIVTVIFTVFSSVMVSNIFLKKIMKNDPAWMRRVISYALLILLLFFSAKEFAQRDMVVTALIFPYIMLMTARMAPLADLENHQKTIILTGLLALMGVAMNPFYGLLIIALEVQYSFMQRKININRPEIIILFLGYSAYLIFIVMHYPNYFTKIVPSYVVLSSSMNASLYELLIQSPSLLTYYATMIFLLLKINKIRHPIFLNLYTGILVCFFVFLLNGKVFSGHVIFLGICLDLFFIVTLCEFLRQKVSQVSQIAFSLFVLILLIYSVIGVICNDENCYMFYSNKHNNFGQLISFFNDQKPRSTFLSLAAQETPTLPVVLYTTLSNQTPWADCWPIVAITKDDVEHDLFSMWKQKKIDKMRKLLPHMIGQILQHDKPEFILVNTKKYQNYLDNSAFDLIVFYSQDLFFKKNWKQYHLVKTVNQYAIYARSNGKAITS